MKNNILVALTIIAMSILSCGDDDPVRGIIKIQNKVQNARLENINFGNEWVGYSLLPGQSSGDIIIEDYEEEFPKKGQIEFQMISNGNTVYLRTQETFELNFGDTLSVVISDDTEVYNPITE